MNTRLTVHSPPQNQGCAALFLTRNGERAGMFYIYLTSGIGTFVLCNVVLEIRPDYFPKYLTRDHIQFSILARTVWVGGKRPF